MCTLHDYLSKLCRAACRAVVEVGVAKLDNWWRAISGKADFKPNTKNGFGQLQLFYVRTRAILLIETKLILPDAHATGLQIRPSVLGGFFRVRPSSSWAYLEPSTSKLLYILVYNSFWLASFNPRLTIVLVAGKLLGVAEIVSHGSNMGFDGESEDRPFGENGRRLGTAVVCQDESNSPRLYEDRSPRRISNRLTD